jgi:hypothetical protein
MSIQIIEPTNLLAAQDAEDSHSTQIETWDAYRPLSLLAIASLALSICSAVAFADPMFVPAGIVLALLLFWFHRRIVHQQDYVRGQGLSLAALGITLLFTVSSIAAHTIEYLTEVPADAMRLSYEQLQPDDRDPEAWIAKMKSLDGKKVFIKGYAFPGNTNAGIRDFMLCRDKGDCCFGGQPKISDRVLVQIANVKGIEYTSSLQKFTGTFRYQPTKFAVQTANGNEIWYILEVAEKL